MDDYLKANKLKAGAPVIEEYVTDPGTEPDESKWLTKIYYLADNLVAENQ
jgi:effector-binding domain-containing protein